MHIGAKYVLQRDVFVWDANSGRPFFDPYVCTPALWLVRPGQHSGWAGYSPLPSVGDYSQTHQPGAIRGVVNAGSMVAFTQIIYHNYFEGDTAYYVFTVLDGPYRKQSMCLNELMSPKPPYSYSIFLVPNPEYIQLRQVPDKATDRR